MLSQKDYKAIADIILIEYTYCADRGQYEAAQSVTSLKISLAKYFRETNPRFDWDKFMRACVPEYH